VGNACQVLPFFMKNSLQHHEPFCTGQALFFDPPAPLLLKSKRKCKKHPVFWGEQNDGLVETTQRVFKLGRRVAI